MEESCSATYGSMSRVGNRLINIPEGVSLENKESQLMVKGPHGSLMWNLCDEVNKEYENNFLSQVTGLSISLDYHLFLFLYLTFISRGGFSLSLSKS